LHLRYAFLAALTASCTSSSLACAISASLFLLAGLMESKYSFTDGSRHSLLINNPNLRLWASNHSSAGFAASGARPYSRVSRISGMVIVFNSYINIINVLPIRLNQRLNSCLTIFQTYLLNRHFDQHPYKKNKRVLHRFYGFLQIEVQGYHLPFDYLAY